MCPARHFWNIIQVVNPEQRVPSTNSIYQLDPFVDKDGVLRVGGRLLKSNLNHKLKHPFLVPKDCIRYQLIIRYYHEKTAHLEEG